MDQLDTSDTYIGKAKRLLAHRCDGPITAFVLIQRACELCVTQQFNPDVVANALDELLVECGYLPNQTPVYQTGS